MIARLPPEFTVMVMPEDTVKGPVAVAFSVASIVVSTSTVCELTLNIPPFLKLPLFCVRYRNTCICCTKIDNKDITCAT